MKILWEFTVMKIAIALMFAGKFIDSSNPWWLVASFFFAIRWTYTVKKGDKTTKYYL